MPTATSFIDALLDPRTAATHLTWALLVLAMLMRDMTWLRTLAIVAGLAIALFGAVTSYDPVAIVWGLALVLVNLLQLALSWLGRRPRLTTDEQLLADRLVPGLKPRKLERLLQRVEWYEAEFGETLVTAGAAVDQLLLVLEGVARVDHEGRDVGILSRGDFLGEQSFASGEGSPVSIVADKPMKLAGLSRDELAALARDRTLRRALAAWLGEAEAPPPTRGKRASKPAEPAL